MQSEPQFPGDSPPASDERLARLIEAFPGSLPAAYLAFLREHDGGQGALGRGFLRLDDVDDVLYNREAYSSWPDWFVVGGDGSSIAYVLDATTEPPAFLAVDTIDDGYRETIGDSLEALFEYVRRSEGLSGW